MYIGFLPYVKGKYHKKHQKLTPSRYPKFAFFWLRSTVASQPIILIKKKMVLSSLLPPSHVRKMGLPETIFQHHSLMTEKLIAIFLHFLTKQTNNHFNHTHKIQLLEQSKKKKKPKTKQTQIHVFQTKQSEYRFIGGEQHNLVVLWPDLVVLWNHTM
jgi:hypothetical protein